MGFLSSLGGTEASQEASRLQAAAVQLGTAETRRARESIRGDLSPFRDQGANLAPGLAALLTDTGKQANLLKKDPFFGKIAERTTQQILASQAAKGKAGAGETTDIVQNKLLQLGTSFVNQNIGQRFNLAAIGSNAAAGLGTSETASASNISELLTQGANARAAGIVGEQNAKTSRNQSAASAAASIFLSDEREKKDIKQIGIHDSTGLPVYSFKYKNDDEEDIGFMAQEVQEKYPDAVINRDGTLYVNYGELLNAN